MKRGLKAALAALLCLLLCSCAMEGGGAERERTEIWYTADSALALPLERLADAYNAQADASMPALYLRSFPDEAALAAAFEIGPPDLTLCSHARAFEWEQRGLLHSASGGPVYSEALTGRSPCVGDGYFPVGFRALLLYAREGALEEGASESMEALLVQAGAYGREKREPFFTAGSFSALLCDMTLSLGSELHGVRAKDIANGNFVRAYNLLAGAAYDNGLAAPDHPAPELVRSGYLPCAAAFSDSLLGAETDGYQIDPLPRLGKPVYLALGEGFAVTATESRGVRRASVLLSWLTARRIGALALEGGLVPALDPEVDAADPLSAALLRMARDWQPGLPAPGCDWFENSDALEQELRQVIELLNG